MSSLRTFLLALAVALVAVVVLVPAARATGEVRWVARHYGSLDGLPVDSASDAAVDNDGFLWLATHDGLARFDGEQFRVYDSMRYPALSGNRIVSLGKDVGGRVYALSAHGDWVRVRSAGIGRVPLASGARQTVGYLDRDSLCVTTARAMYCPDGHGHFPEYVGFPEGVKASLAVRGIHGTVWMLTRARDIWLYRHGVWRVLWRAGASQGRSAPIYAAVAADGALWTEIRNRLLRVALDGTQRYLTGAEQPHQIVQIRRGNDGRIWVGAGNGVFVVEHGAPQRMFAASEPGGGAGGLSWRAPDGALWVAGGAHLWRLPPAWQPGSPVPQPVLVSEGDIQRLRFGPGQLVWVLTLRDGIYRLNRPRVHLLDADDGLAGGNVYSIARGGDGTMWLGTLGSGLVSVAPDDSIRHYGRAAGLPGPNPWLVSVAPDGSVYVATYAPGLWRRAPGASRFRQVVLPQALQRERIRAVTFDDQGHPWIGTTAGAWQRTGGRWQRVWPQTDQRLRVNDIVMTERGIWYATTAGVWFQHGQHGYAVAEALLGHVTVRNLRFTRDGALWISTVGHGLVRVAADDPHGRQPRQLGRAQGLPSNSPHTIRQDADGNIWVNSNQGIFRIAPAALQALLAGERAKLSPLVLGRSDGLAELEGNGGVQPAAAWDGRGRLWFPSQAGVVRFDPLAIQAHGEPPPPIITGLTSEGRKVTLSDTGALPIGVRNVRIAYGVANLFGSGESRFRYRLAPQSRGWTATSVERSAVFTALPPGHYRFELLAANSDGVWTTQPSVLRFEVPAYWYETTSARVAAAAGLLLLVLFAMWLRGRDLQRRASKLDRQVRDRTRDVSAERDRAEAAVTELANAHRALADGNRKLAAQTERLEQLGRFRTRLLADVSHELRTPVMLVGLPLRELAEHPGQLPAQGRERLELASRQLGRLQALVEQLVGLVQAESGQMPLRLQRLDLVAELQRMVHDYGAKAAAAGTELGLEAEAHSLVLFADAAHLATVFGNLIDNAIKHAPGRSRIRVVVARVGEQAVVEVRDHGPGFDPAAAQHLFERFYRDDGPPRDGREGLGIGLSLARELVELHGGQIEAEAAPGEGATFRVSLPTGSAHVALDDLALDEVAADALPADAAPLTVAEGRLLLVEDHPDLATYLAERLGERLPTLQAASAEQARQLLGEHHDIRLVVSDVVLPGDSGIELCRGLAGKVPVLLISARAADTDRRAGLAAGAQAYLAKPFGFDELLEAIACAWPAVAARLGSTPADPATLDPLLRMALDNLPDAGFHVGDWAERAHLSARQLRRRVRELSGQAPQAWLREQRLQRVRQLLGSGHCKTLAEAGNQAGFDNPAYLYRSYRARFGKD